MNMYFLFFLVGQLKHRRVKHYGYEFKYSINNVDPDDPLPESIPELFKPMLEKLKALGHIHHYPDQLTVNEYQPGQGKSSKENLVYQYTTVKAI